MMRVAELIETEEPKTRPEQTENEVKKEHIWEYIWKVYNGEIDISAS